MDYSPFGMILPGRSHFTSDAYRFGYNGKEKEDVNGNQLDFGARIYDSRLGRWLSLDPVKKPWQSDYLVLSNSPIWKVDPNGTDDYSLNKKGNLALTKKTDDKFDMVYNSDKTDKIKLTKDFILKSHTTGKTKDGEYEHFVSTNINEAREAYKFFGNNSDVEWSLSIFDYKKQVSVLTTSHDELKLGQQADITTDILNRNEHIKLVEHSHSHPGVYDPSTTWPAYPSGFTERLNPDFFNQGDRDYYDILRKTYKGRIPPMFSIFVPNQPLIVIEYNDNKVNRILPPNVDSKTK